jgi:hypothetical protein
MFIGISSISKCDQSKAQRVDRRNALNRRTPLTRRVVLLNVTEDTDVLDGDKVDRNTLAAESA